MQAPTSTHWTSTNRVLRYLKHIVDFGLHCKSSIVALHAFCDVDWASKPNDRRSSSSYDIYFGQCLVSWSSKKQHVVSRSNTEAAYWSLALTTAKVYWIYMLCENCIFICLHPFNPIFHV
jgi:hypothetical protein